mmetsp:Transcript_138380/g.441388  ORF Transcript_138380/g.441388 Transcript_138380/m.441388 type:complete len:260 (-) Transcript_138380:250-1029(-)|eukprot:CAMPEP_0203885890 /NCGR_PEP_ID=MMETSP0359-20131031/29756_1 /ASSEMBLY_ACC=CAM_ASM_000338 /TAXON_ID=268821 /ORGANISM="Scrippsiella Hangoei, Strain SHTV-5" /LENGTH=259 /DNA_ID=CAMNT_0050806597 /DNA_START=37 /DNA_END=816 /DNA_ORIENTATION=+
MRLASKLRVSATAATALHRGRPLPPPLRAPSAPLLGVRRAFAEGGEGGGYPPPDLARLGTADLADIFIGDVYDYDSQAAFGTSASSSAAAPGSQSPKRAAQVQAVAPLPRFYDFGGETSFWGPISTVQCFENNLMVRAALSEPGDGRVLVIDTAGSVRAALVGDNLAELAVKNGWRGLLLNGFLRDAACLRSFPLGVKALGTYPVKSGKRDWGLRDVPVRFGGVVFRPGDFLYSDEDGILVADADLHEILRTEGFAPAS